MIEDGYRKAFLVEAHWQIELAVKEVLKTSVPPGSLSYPPGGPGLSHEEAEAMQGLDGSPALKSALRKLVANATARAIFGLFCVCDGVADPRCPLPAGAWRGLDLVEAGDASQRPMLHDDFLDAYWDFIEAKAAFVRE